jgi:hypothetical protein
MLRPVSNSLGFMDDVGYVAFRILAKGERVGGARIAAGVDVVVDRDAAGCIVGIELLQLDRETFRAAGRFARSAGLVFPIQMHAVKPV